MKAIKSIGKQRKQTNKQADGSHVPVPQVSSNSRIEIHLKLPAQFSIIFTHIIIKKSPLYHLSSTFKSGTLLYSEV